MMPVAEQMKWYDVWGTEETYNHMSAAGPGPLTRPSLGSSRTPQSWAASGPANPDPLNNQVLEIYDLNTDFSQSQNMAGQYPDKVNDLKQMFIEEAKKYQVFPMDASVAGRIVAPRPNITAGRTEYVYTLPMTGLAQGDSPFILNSSYTITAEIDVTQGANWNVRQ